MGNLVWYVYESRKNHRLLVTISATSTTTATLTTSPDIRKIKQHSPCNNIQKLRILSLSLFRIKTNKMSQLNINKRAGTIMEHISCPSFWSVRSTMLRIFHCLGYNQLLLVGFITMMFQWYLR